MPPNPTGVSPTAASPMASSPMEGQPQEPRTIYPGLEDFLPGCDGFLLVSEQVLDMDSQDLEQVYTTGHTGHTDRLLVPGTVTDCWRLAL